MKAIFPNAQLLQPMPSSDNVHANISGNANNTTPSPDNSEPAQNTSNIQTNPANTQPSAAKNSINLAPYFFFFIIILLIMFIYRKLKRK